MGPPPIAQMNHVFDFAKVNVHWFPSHMARGIQAMEKKLRKTDILVEIRDARIPFSSANPILENLSRDLKRIVVFNKTDLSDPASNRRLETYLKQNSSVEFMLMDSTNRRQTTRLLESIKAYCLPRAKEKPELKFKMIVAGMPNVGKSTVINRLRAIGTSIGGKAVRTGGLPGITRAVSEFVRISPFPHIYMLDTPGVLMPKIVDPEMGLKIGLCGGMIDRVVGEYVLAEYLLHTLNTSGNPKLQRLYQRHFALEGPVERLEQLLPHVAKTTGQMQSGTMNLTNTIAILLRLFRTGELGRVTLDKIPD